MLGTYKITLPPDAENIVSNFFEKLDEPQAKAYYDAVRALPVPAE